MDLIDRQEVLSILRVLGCFANPKCLDGIRRKVKELPTVDAVPVVHWRWIQPDDALDDFWKCSACGVEWFMEDDGGWNYCPNCGAKMDGERSEGE